VRPYGSVRGAFGNGRPYRDFRTAFVLSASIGGPKACFILSDYVLLKRYTSRLDPELIHGGSGTRPTLLYGKK
jgi:hypothetical protein